MSASVAIASSLCVLPKHLHVVISTYFAFIQNLIQTPKRLIFSFLSKFSEKDHNFSSHDVAYLCFKSVIINQPFMLMICIYVLRLWLCSVVVNVI